MAGHFILRVTSHSIIWLSGYYFHWLTGHLSSVWLVTPSSDWLCTLSLVCLVSLFPRRLVTPFSNWLFALSPGRLVTLFTCGLATLFTDWLVHCLFALFLFRLVIWSSGLMVQENNHTWLCIHLDDSNVQTTVTVIKLSVFNESD